LGASRRAEGCLAPQIWRAPRRIREEQEVNQEEAAECCGLHRTYYSGIERGVRNVSLVNIEKVAKGLRTSLPKLFERL
jgi:transcriptional regulator with XRE-family HTH domain